MCEFTIITVCYNSESSIEKTIKSVITQREKSWEYVFVDGKSNDNTLNIILNYKKQIEEQGHTVTVISEPDNGIYDAMNKGVCKAKGNWVVFLNSGDVFASNDVLQNVNNIILQGNYDIIYGNAQTDKGVAFATRDPWLLPYKKPFYHQAAFVKRSLQESLEFDTSYRICADFDFFQRAYLRKYNFKRIDLLIAVSDSEGVSKKPENRARVINEDLNVIKNNHINWLRFPYSAYFWFKRKYELMKIIRSQR